MIHRHDQHRLIDIRGDNMRFLRQVCRFPDNIIFPVLDPVDHRAIGIHLHLNNIPYRNGIRGFNPFHPEFSLYPTLHHLPRIHAYGVPTSGRLHNNPFHTINLMVSVLLECKYTRYNFLPIRSEENYNIKAYKLSYPRQPLVYPHWMSHSVLLPDH